jgi:hypothetical protein
MVNFLFGNNYWAFGLINTILLSQGNNHETIEQKSIDNCPLPLGSRRNYGRTTISTHCCGKSMGSFAINWLCTLGALRDYRMKEHGAKQINGLMDDLLIATTVFLVGAATLIISSLG